MLKPVSLNRLSARVKALMRREPQITNPRLMAKGIVLDTITRQVRMENRQIDLTPKEYGVLEYLLRNSGKVVSRAMLEQHVWGTNIESSSNIVDTNIKRLREKLDPDGVKDLIQAIWGAGYRFNA